MEQRKVQRIVGILVIIVLVIIVMPLMFGKNNFPMQEASSFKAPPFSDQKSAPSSDNTSDAKLPEPPVLAADTTQQPNPSDMNQSAPPVGKVIYEPAPPVAAVETPAPVAEKAVDQQPIASPAQPLAEKINVNTNKSENKKPAKTMQPPPVKKGKDTQTRAPRSLHAKASSPLPNKGWVVQMGNFAVKNNATRLADKLRAAGYKVFIHDVKLSSGKINTRVYVGPELRQASATQLSHRIHQNLNLQGFVVVYKTLRA